MTNFILERIGRLIDELGTLRYQKEKKITFFKQTKSKEKFKDIQHLSTESWNDFDCNNQLWGGHREYFWFDTEIQIGKEYHGDCVVFRLTTGREGYWDAVNPQFTIYVNGQLRQGFDVNHRELILTDCAEGNESFRITMAAFTGDQNFTLYLHASILALDLETEKYYYDLKIPYDAACLLDKEDRDYLKIVETLNNSLNILDLRNTESPLYRTTLKSASEYLKHEFYEKQKTNCPQTVFCVGHTHIDCAWLWSMAVTRDKAVRSFSTVLELMNRYPEYIFMSSQPLLYEFVKEDAPEVYEQIKKRVAEGRWEVNGGMWVEADCNLSSGEALVRQFMIGKRFFKEEFGKDNDILWLPDVFGYSAALPQIMKKSGIPYFMTTKISWNETNKMPYDTFMWEGIDGTKVLTHFICTPTAEATDSEKIKSSHNTTYNGSISPWKLNGGWQRYQQKYLNDEVLNCFGFGDGGGGPTKEMLETQRRTAQSFPGCIPSKPETASNFFKLLDREVSDRKDLPVWVGELYLEYHRGTYTTMARNKKYNRKSEFAAQNAEFYSLLAERLTSLPYPKQKIYQQWKMILRNQFHDILPGSSIKEVYEDSKREYEALLAELHEISSDALDSIASQVLAPSGSAVLFNPTGFSGPAVVELSLAENTTIQEGLNALPSQILSNGNTAVALPSVPSRGYAAYPVCSAKPDSDGLQISNTRLENQFFCLKLNDKGHFTSIYDKRYDRELLKPGQLGNTIISYEDKPHNYDAWDINNYYTEKSWPVDDVQSIRITEQGDVLASLRIERSYLSSSIVQTITIYRDLPQIDIKNEIDWKEHQILLKTLFPLDLHFNEATYEIQYGNVTRPTHYNTSWDAARFEVCHHKWMDVAEGGYGVSFLNDCKFGCNVHDSVVGLTMLKSALYPNPDADKEFHSFTYTILPHEGSWKEAHTVERAYLLNNPPEIRIKNSDGGTLPAAYSMVQCSAENVVIEVVKKAEYSEHMVIRLYETQNRRTDATLTFPTEIRSASESDLMEENEVLLSASGNTLSIRLKPYEIKTLILDI